MRVALVRVRVRLGWSKPVRAAATRCVAKMCGPGRAASVTRAALDNASTRGGGSLSRPTTHNKTPTRAGTKHSTSNHV